MQEAFLHFLWKFRHLPGGILFTTSGLPVRIIKTGTHNSDSGPDFLHAELEIGETRWAGNVEIHLKATDWDRHNHSTDPRYDNVILHVVFENDRALNGRENMPVL